MPAAPTPAQASHHLRIVQTPVFVEWVIPWERCGAVHSSDDGRGQTDWQPSWRAGGCRPTVGCAVNPDTKVLPPDGRGVGYAHARSTVARNAMPAPLPLAVRRLIQRRARRGQSAAAIACALGLRPRTVRQLLRHFGEQLERLEPAYQPGPGQPADRHPLYAQALALRQQHPSWGRRATSASVWPAPLMLRCCPASVPCSVGSVSNTSRRLLPDGGPRPRRRGPLPPTTPGRWMPWNSYAWAAVKASAGCVWSTNTVVPSLAPRFSPTTSGAMSCRPRCSSSCGRRSPAGDCPASLRVDNGKPWGSWSDLPPALGAVADRLGHRHDLERPVLPSAERGRRAFARDSEALGGAPHLWQCSRTANPAG